MRILMLTWEFPPRTIGGLAQHVFELTRALNAGGGHVDVITSGGDKLPEHEKMGKVGVWRVIPCHNALDLGFIDWVQRLNFALLEKGIHLCRVKGKYDLIHAHDWLVAYAAAVLKHSFTIPLLATIHATEYGRNNGLHNDQQRYIGGVEWWLTYEAWKVICCSRYMKEEVQNVFALPGDKVVVVPNGIRPRAYEVDDMSISAFFPDLEEKIIFYIGRMVQEKGVQILLEAAGEILKHFPRTTFALAGTGPYKETLEKRAAELGLGEKVVFKGYIDDRTRNLLYRRADVAVFPSLYEPFGIVALEAMATGTPVVVSSTGGLDEIVDHEKDGLKVWPGDARILAEQICRLLENEQWAASLAEQAYQKVLDHYVWDRIAEKTAGLYRDIILSPANKKWQQEAASPKEDTLKVEKPSEKPPIPRLI